MTEGAQFVVGGVLLAASYVEVVVDYITTVKALDAGAKEVGAIAGAVVKKWGKNALAPYTFAVAAAITVAGAVTGTIGADYFLVSNLGLAAGFAVNLFLNFKGRK